ncbi:MFS transporter [Rhodospirillaceae bacterium SYSU D60014]|uniref:MFS transporter n=1 Tax=Virgifigura deserti TaxID=2268457 RepID=UPI000E66897E
MSAEVAPAGTLTPRQRRLSLIAVIASMTVISLIYGLSVPLLSLALDRQGVGSVLIGLNTAVQPLATLAMAPVAPWIVARLGPAHTMIYATIGSAAIFLLFPTIPDLFVWFPLRFLLGCVSCFFWIVGEAWVNQMATERNRGRIVSIYAAAGAGGTALGPLLLTLTGTEGWMPFLAAAALITLSGTPLLLATKLAPRLEGRPSARLHLFLMLAPLAMILNLVHGASIEIFLTFFPLYGLRLGLGEAAPLYLLTILLLGGIVLQVPLGWLADHMDRRLLVSLSILFVIACLLAMPVILPVPGWNWVFMFVYGGVFSALYGFAIMLLGERFRGTDLVYAATVFNVMWSVGSTAGPAIGGVGMRLWDPHGMIVVLVVLWLLYLPIPIISHIRRRRAGSVPDRHPELQKQE